MVIIPGIQAQGGQRHGVSKYRRAGLKGLARFSAFQKIFGTG